MTSTTEIILFFVFLVVSAFFSGVETAVLAFPKLRLQSLVQKKNKRAILLKKMLANPQKLISTILIGNNIANAAAASLATVIVTNLVSEGGASQGTIVILATLFATVFLLIVGEITPKSYAIQKPVTLALFAVLILKFAQMIFTPVVFVLSGLSKFLEKLGKQDKKHKITQDDVRALSTLLREDRVFEPEHLKMISNIFEFSTRQINKVMVPRSDVQFIRNDATYQDVKMKIKKFNYKRYPVYKEHRDEILGIFNAYKLLFYNPETSAKPFDIKDYLIPALFVSEFSSLLNVLEKMKDTQTPFALVVDEYGSVTGAVTLEVVLEEIVGDIIDETDSPIHKIYSSSQETNTHIVAGDITFDELEKECGITLSKNIDVETLGGLIWHEVGEKPKVGTEIVYDDYILRIENMFRNRIKKVTIKKIKADVES